MKKGLDIEDIKIGTGGVAARGDIVCVNLVTSLNRGDEIQSIIDYEVDLSRRHVVAGLRYGIEGMREGGKRKIRVGPHLAYGAAGLPGVIPENAVVIFQVELLNIVSSAG